jgi:hypothetical protein
VRLGDLKSLTRKGMTVRFRLRAPYRKTFAHHSAHSRDVMSGIRFLGPYEDRVAAELPEGFVVGVCKSDCRLSQGAIVQGVFRRLGEQEWSDEHGHVATVMVEDFDLDSVGLRNWSTGVE